LLTESRWYKWYSGWEWSIWNASSDWGRIHKYGFTPLLSYWIDTHINRVK